MHKGFRIKYAGGKTDWDDLGPAIVIMAYACAIIVLGVLGVFN